jgi:hypothetical protein
MMGGTEPARDGILTPSSYPNLSMGRLHAP